MNQLVRRRERITVTVVALVLIGMVVSALPADVSAQVRRADIPIDLAALVLTPEDLAAEGMHGYGLDYGERLTTEQIAAGFAVEQNIPLERAVRIYDGLGLVQSYSVRIAKPTEPGDFLSVATDGVLVSLVEYDGEPGAAALSLGAESGTDIEWEIVEGNVTVGDESILSEKVGEDAGKDIAMGDPSIERTIEFRRGRFYAVVTVFDVAREGEASNPVAPAIELVEALAFRLLDRIETATESALPSLGLQAIRLASNEETVVTVGDRYQSIAGAPLPRFAETEDEIAARAALLATDEMVAVYGVEQDVRSGPAENPGDPHLGVRLYQFVDADAAETWVAEVAFDRFAEDPYLDSLDPIATPARIDGVALLAEYTAEYGGTELDGLVVWIQIDEIVARVSIDAADGVDTGVITTLAEAQTGCIADGRCYELVTVPNSLSGTPD